jgi:transposase
MARYKVTLEKEEREALMEIISKENHSTHKFKAAYVLLHKDQGKHADKEKVTNEEISKVLKVGMRTIDRIKKRFVEEGFDSTLERKSAQREYERKADGDVEAKLVTLCCSDPPEGHAKWTLRLLADKMVELNYVDSISHEAVRNTLKKTNLNLGK